MYEKKMNKTIDICGMGITMEVMGGKWKPCLIQSIHTGLKRPSELHRAHPTASPRVLNQHLSELEEYGIVEKLVHPVLPPKVEYSLTAFGKSLLPVTQAMEAWGLQYEATFLEMHEKRLQRLEQKEKHA
jgi:DNA-binding HxlR family transcriptional regulator